MNKPETTEPFPSTCSGGGPVIAIPAELAAAWRGTHAPIGAQVPPGWTWGKSGGPVCDYDRACDGGREQVMLGHSALAWLEVGDGKALVLDAELNTVWIPEENGGVIARGGVDGSAQTRDLIPTSGWEDFPATLVLRDGRLFMFDSAFKGAADPSEIEADDGVAVGKPGPGTYSLSVATAGSNAFIRLTRSGA